MSFDSIPLVILIHFNFSTSVYLPLPPPITLPPLKNPLPSPSRVLSSPSKVESFPPHIGWRKGLHPSGSGMRRYAPLPGPRPHPSPLPSLHTRSNSRVLPTALCNRTIFNNIHCLFVPNAPCTPSNHTHNIFHPRYPLHSLQPPYSSQPRYLSQPQFLRGIGVHLGVHNIALCFVSLAKSPLRTFSDRCPQYRALVAVLPILIN